MKIIIAPDSFKGTLSSKKAGDLAAEAFRAAAAEKGAEVPEIHKIIMADGGEGTVEALVSGVGGSEIVSLDVRGPDPGQTVKGFYGILPDKTAVVELAAAAALTQTLLRDPEKTTTYGTGQLISDALDGGPKKIILALGGSATNDGGCGAAAALGAVFRDRNGKSFVPTGGTLRDIADIDVSGMDERLGGVKIEVMCDVTNPLCGENGAAAVFAPQKGADPEMVKRLDEGLAHLAEVWSETNGEAAEKIKTMPGGGAAGGCGAGAVMFLNACLRGGADVILDAAGFDRLAENADLVITGEGKFDMTSLGGKAAGAVAGRCRRYGIPCVVLAGAADPIGYGVLKAAGVTAVFSTQRAAVAFEDVAPRAERDMYEAALNLARVLMK